MRQIVYDLTPHLIFDGLVSTVKRSSELGFLTQSWLGLCLETNLKQRRREGGSFTCSRHRVVVVDLTQGDLLLLWSVSALITPVLTTSFLNRRADFNQ